MKSRRYSDNVIKIPSPQRRSVLINGAYWGEVDEPLPVLNQRLPVLDPEPSGSIGLLIVWGLIAASLTTMGVWLLLLNIAGV